MKLLVATSLAGMSAARICVCSQLSLRLSVWPAAFYHDAFVTGVFHIQHDRCTGTGTIVHVHCVQLFSDWKHSFTTSAIEA